MQAYRLAYGLVSSLLTICFATNNILLNGMLPVLNIGPLSLVVNVLVLKQYDRVSEIPPTLPDDGVDPVATQRHPFSTRNLLQHRTHILLRRKRHSQQKTTRPCQTYLIAGMMEPIELHTMITLI